MIESSDQRQMASDDLTQKLELWGDMDLSVHEDDDFTIENLMSLESTELLLWFGHGTQVSDLHSVLYTTEATTMEKSIEYVDLIRSKEVTVAGGGAYSLSGGYYCITAKFVQNYFPEMEDALVILNACKGGMDSYLSAAFLSKGAETVIAYSDTVPIWYTYLLTYDVLRYMSGGGGDEAYHTVQEALGLAKEDFGVTGRIGAILEDALDDPEPISLDDARAINGKYEYQAFDLTLFSEYVPSDQAD